MFWEVVRKGSGGDAKQVRVKRGVVKHQGWRDAGTRAGEADGAGLSTQAITQILEVAG